MEEGNNAAVTPEWAENQVLQAQQEHSRHLELLSQYRANDEQDLSREHWLGYAEELSDEQNECYNVVSPHSFVRLFLTYVW